MAGFPAYNILVDGVTDSQDPNNYWMGQKDKKSEIVIKLGCSVPIQGVTLRNSRDAQNKEHSTAKFKIFTSEDDDEVLEGEFEDLRYEYPDEIPSIFFPLKARGRFVKLKAEDWYGSGGGATLQFLDIHSSFFEPAFYGADNALTSANCDNYMPEYIGPGFR